MLIQHKTSYRYQSEVLQSKNSAHVLPAHFCGQNIVQHKLKLTPEPTEIDHHPDYFGNPITIFDIDTPHDELIVDLKLWVTRHISQQHQKDIDLDEALHLFKTQTHLLPKECWALLPHSKGTPYLDKLSQEFSEVISGESSLLTACKKTMEHVFNSFTFDSNFSNLQTPLEDIYRARKGVCQDLSHIMLSGLRSLGIPCRYVSGYLETLPPPGKKKLIGVDASHAWVSVYIPETGWVDLDPTNNMIPAQHHVNMAWGRDYHDISPMKGVFHGYAQSQLSVSVDVSECPRDQWPSNRQVDQ
jgi:transglutaminase-like putative cysteine protease